MAPCQVKFAKPSSSCLISQKIRYLEHHSERSGIFRILLIYTSIIETLNIDCSFQPRALTGVQTSNVSQTLQSSTGKSKHSRAASELSSSQLRTTKAEHSKSKSSNSSILNSYTEQSSGDFKLSRNLSASDTSIDMKFQLAMRSKDNTADGVMLSISNFETKCCVKPSVPAISTSEIGRAHV